MSADFTQPVVIDPEGLYDIRLYFGWGQRTVGFGECRIYNNSRDGKLHADTENMSREWLRHALHSLADRIADSAVIDG